MMGILAMAAIAAIIFVGSVLWATVTDMCKDEVRTRLSGLPHLLIRVASLRIPRDVRGDITAEWNAELYYILRGTEGLPVTRLLRGVTYSVDLVLRGAPAVAREIAAAKAGSELASGLAKQADIPVAINVYDFIGNKTGIFGMTRSGKSKTMKAVAARVFAVSERRRAAGQPPIGQLIFDPQGEYANPNTQNGAKLAAIGVDHVVIYRFGETQNDQPNVHLLGVNSDLDFRHDIYHDLLQGRIVIIDLHLGRNSVVTRLARDMVGYLIERQTERLTSGEDLPHIQVMIDEAHNLFSSDRFKNEFDVWVRLAKEGRKLRIGMVYATQDVSAVANQVLANTENWLAT
jgi:DNA helicase HerA-like ATPase